MGPWEKYGLSYSPCLPQDGVRYLTPENWPSAVSIKRGTIDQPLQGVSCSLKRSRMWVADATTQTWLLIPTNLPVFTITVLLHGNTERTFLTGYGPDTQRETPAQHNIVLLSQCCLGLQYTASNKSKFPNFFMRNEPSGVPSNLESGSSRKTSEGHCFTN